jgi:L-alanine-DL-glutamate epimerase-like enolase superfamily enzyme
MKPRPEGGPPVENVAVSCYTIPTETSESDGTLSWTETTLVLVEAQAGGEKGIGYSYADVATGKLVESLLSDVMKGINAFDVPGAHDCMLHKIRNLGRPGITSMAISAVDNALWDLKARLLGVSLLDLLGAVRESAMIYGSGGFTSYSVAELQTQLSDWAAQGIKMVKMKIGREPAADFERVRAAREAIGPLVELYVDANGAYSRKQALVQAEHFAELDVRWFEEPVSSDDLEGLRLLRDRAPAGMNIAAGEYGYDICYFVGCWQLERWMFCRQTRRAVAALQGSCRQASYARRSRCRFPFTAPPRFTWQLPAPYQRFGWENTFLTMLALRTCFSMVCRNR